MTQVSCYNSELTWQSFWKLRILYRVTVEMKHFVHLKQCYWCLVLMSIWYSHQYKLCAHYRVYCPKLSIIPIAFDELFCMWPLHVEISFLIYPHEFLFDWHVSILTYIKMPNSFLMRVTQLLIFLCTLLFIHVTYSF